VKVKFETGNLKSGDESPIGADVRSWHLIGDGERGSAVNRFIPVAKPSWKPHRANGSCVWTRVLPMRAKAVSPPSLCHRTPNSRWVGRAVGIESLTNQDQRYTKKNQSKKKLVGRRKAVWRENIKITKRSQIENARIA
jgi:hypothetical protein